MDIAAAAISLVLIAAGVVALICVGAYWIVLRMDDIDHRHNLLLALWAIVIIVLGIVGLLWAGTMPDSTRFF